MIRPPRAPRPGEGSPGERTAAVTAAVPLCVPGTDPLPIGIRWRSGTPVRLPAKGSHARARARARSPFKRNAVPFLYLSLRTLIREAVQAPVQGRYEAVQGERASKQVDRDLVRPTGPHGRTRSKSPQTVAAARPSLQSAHTGPKAMVLGLMRLTPPRRRVLPPEYPQPGNSNRSAALVTKLEF